MPCDVYVKEAEQKGKDAEMLIVLPKDTPKKPKKLSGKMSIINLLFAHIFEKPQMNNDMDKTLTQLEKQFKKIDSDKITDVTVLPEETKHSKPFVPDKIGKPVKPYINKIRKRY